VAVSSAIIVNRAVKRLLSRFAIDRAVFHLGRLVPDAVSKYLMTHRGVQWYCYEAGPLAETLRLAKNETIYDYDFYTRSWGQYYDRPLNPSQKNKVAKYLQSRRGDPEKTGLFTYSPTNHDGLDVYTLLGINQGQKLVSFFTSSIDECAFIPTQGQFDSIYGDQQEAIKELLTWVSDKSQYTLIIRIHPNEGSKRNHLGMRGQKSIERLTSIFEHSKIPQNVRVVWPDDEVSSYLIGDSSSVVLVWQSTIGMELAASSKPVILLDNALYRAAGFCYVPYQKGDLGMLIAKAESCSHNEIYTRREKAEAWVYHQDFRMAIDFPLVKDHGRWERVSLEFDDPASIQASEHDHLRRIVDCLTNDVWPYRD
jgi:hypothetical protein